MRDMWRVMVVAIAACGSSKKAPAESGPVTDRALAAAPLENVNAKAGTVAFSIQLPMSLLEPGKIEGTNVSWEVKHASFDTPSFTVLFLDTPLGAGDLGMGQPMGEDAADREIAHNDHLPGGGYLQLDQRKDHAFFEVEVCKPSPGGQLCCNAIQRNSKPIDGFAEIVALAEKVCTSVTPR